MDYDAICKCNTKMYWVSDETTNWSDYEDRLEERTFWCPSCGRLLSRHVENGENWLEPMSVGKNEQ